MTHNSKPGPLSRPRPRRVLFGEVLVEEDPSFDQSELGGPILMQGYAAGAGAFAVYATLHDKVITVVSQYRPPLRATLAALTDAMLTARPSGRGRKKTPGGPTSGGRRT